MKLEFFLMILGIASLEALLIGLVVYAGGKIIMWYFKPEQGSNAHLSEWLATGKTWEEFNVHFGS